VEVGCERFFGISGYVSALRHSRLGVRAYERLAMLSSIIRSIYIDPKWVAEEYLRRGRQKKWKKLDDEEALKGWNLELEIEAELDNEAYALELTMEDIIGELVEEEVEKAEVVESGKAEVVLESGSESDDDDDC
jgi:hypothetical protein